MDDDERQLAEMNLRERWELEQRLLKTDPAYELWLNKLEHEHERKRSDFRRTGPE